jgi:UDP-glucose 4-epimerase
MRVVVIGATGNIGTATMRALVADPAVTSVIGVARRLPDLRAEDKVSWVAADVETDDLSVVAGADAVVHLAWKIQPQRDPAEMAGTNILGTRRVIDAVTRFGVPALVAASSVGAYSRGPKDRRVDETWPTHGVPSSVYSRHKAATEQLFDDAERDFPTLRLARLRTSLVVQRSAASEIHRIFLGGLAPWHLPRAMRWIPKPRRLLLQVTHADDVADAYRRAVLSDISGPLNVAAEPVLTPDLIARAVGGRTFRLPAAPLRAAVDVSYRLRLQRSEPGWLDMALDVPLMDTTRVRTELGWTELHSSADALLELLDGIGAGAGDATEPLQPRPRRRTLSRVS